MGVAQVDVAEHCVVVDGNSDSWAVLSELVVVEHERPSLTAKAVETDELFAVEVAVDMQLVDTVEKENEKKNH